MPNIVSRPLLKPLNLHKNLTGRDHHRLNFTRETEDHRNQITGLDPRPGKGRWGDNWQDLNNVCRLDQGSANCLCERPESRYLGLCEPAMRAPQKSPSQLFNSVFVAQSSPHTVDTKIWISCSFHLLNSSQLFKSIRSYNRPYNVVETIWPSGHGLLGPTTILVVVLWLDKTMPLFQKIHLKVFRDKVSSCFQLVSTKWLSCLCLHTSTDEELILSSSISFCDHMDEFEDDVSDGKKI